MQDAFPLLVLAAFFVVMWLLFIRPQGRRTRELARMQAALEVGDEVMLTSGVFGVLRELGETDVRVEIADGVTIRVARGAVGKVEHEHDEHDDDQHDQHDDVSEEN